ncbi:biotin transporter BioY [Clostridium sp. YIM B02515]|uniref:Biotin transporter n=1 Tax=Clostridium rhizosphaerae TaxID=2803861 RepID=A0ABS1T9D7_9CLOT|nr:biotin transporter BioY [Clostridium rhizosphaerae]MBL4935958.1 biotin transporter BioY [Clostridium rhizosphaerae]
MKITTREMIFTALFAALTAIGAFIKIPIGAVPITLQFLFTALAGIMLGSRLGALSQLLYVIIGLLGIPVFASGAVGLNAVISPSFGYLIGFVLGAYVIGKVTESSRKAGFVRLFTACILGMIVIYLIGVPYLYLIIKNVMGKNINFSSVLKTGFIVFLPGDLTKCIIAAALGAKIVSVLKKAA